jgi:transcriptional regulator with XRE-family HTH domain
MEKDVTNRITAIMKQYGIDSAADLGREIGINRTTVSHVLTRRNNASADFLQAIILKWSDINARWLMTGEGEMLDSKNEHTPPSVRPTSLRDANHDLFSSQITRENPAPKHIDNQVDNQESTPIINDRDLNRKDDTVQPISTIDSKEDNQDIKSKDISIEYKDSTIATEKKLEEKKEETDIKESFEKNDEIVKVEKVMIFYSDGTFDVSYPKK